MLTENKTSLPGLKEKRYQQKRISSGTSTEWENYPNRKFAGSPI